MTGWSRQRPQHPYPVAFLLCAALLLARLPPAVAQTPPLPPIHYVYDELNRLIAVIDRDNSAAGYVYDAVGNILAIERFDVTDIPGAIGITFVAPGKGKAATKVTIYGKGFGASAAQVSVSFNGTSATVESVSGNRISTTVPVGATTGYIVVTAPLGPATSPKAFRVLGPITIQPSAAQVPFGGTQQLTALAQGGAAIAAFWEVNGIRGGNASIGTISTSGLYTAPSVLGGSSIVTITAVDKDDVSTFATATLTILPPLSATTVSRAISVSVATPNVVDRSLTASVSVAVMATPTTSAAAPAVSVSVAGTGQATSAAPPASVSIEPVIASIVPASGARGAISMFVTLNGAGFTGASDVTFLRNNVADTNITVANIQVNGDGTQATAEVTIAAGANVGAHAVRITTPSGVSTAIGTGGNIFTVE
jgi:YD repeat-containing protein